MPPGFLGGAPASPLLEEVRTATERFQPTIGLAASTAFKEARSLFGFKPLQDLSEIARLRGHEGGELFGVNAGAFDLMMDKEIDGTPTSRMMDPDEANETFGIEGQLKFTVPISEDEAKFKQLRKFEEIKRNYILYQNKGFLNNLATFGIEFVADITDPIGLSTLLFPVTSFRTVVKLGQKVGQKVAPYAVGAGEAAAGIVVPLTPGYFASQEFQYSFTPGDYGISLAGGVAIGGLIRKLLYMKDLNIHAAKTIEAEKQYQAMKNFHRVELNNVKNKTEDIVLDHSKENANNPEIRQHATVEIVEGKLDSEWLDSLIDINNDLAVIGRVPIKENIKKYDNDLKALLQHKKNLEGLLEVLPKESKYRKDAVDLLYDTEEYIKLNKVNKKKLIDRLPTLGETEDTPSIPVDPIVQAEATQNELFKIRQIESELARPSSQGEKSADLEIAKKIRNLFEGHEDIIEMLDSKKLRSVDVSARDILKYIIGREGTLTIKNIMRAFLKDRFTPDNTKVKAFLDKNHQRYNTPANQEMGSGDKKAIDYQNDVDATPEERIANDVSDNFNKDTEMGTKDYVTDPDATAEAAELQAESVKELFAMMKQNIKTPENPDGIYSKKAIEVIEKRYLSDAISGEKAENALSRYHACALKYSRKI